MTKDHANVRFLQMMFSGILPCCWALESGFRMLMFMWSFGQSSKGSCLKPRVQADSSSTTEELPKTSPGRGRAVFSLQKYSNEMHFDLDVGACLLVDWIC